VREAQDRIDADEFGEWMALYGIEPWGDARGDIQAAVIASTVANTVPRKGEAAKLSDYMLSFEPPEPPDPKELSRKINEIFGRIAGR
jgi:hypothetical protein